MRPHRGESVGKLVERQIQTWKQAGGEKAAEEPKEKMGPYVTLSRDFGCGALEVAAALARNLRWQVYDKEIVDQIAEEAHVLNSVVESVDEKTRIWLDDYISRLWNREHLAPARYVEHLAHVVTTLAKHGKAILVGRGANYLLPAEAGVRVRLTASKEWREANLMESRGISEAEARRTVLEEDLNRLDFVRDHFHKDIQDPNHYDLVINVQGFRVEDVAAMIHRALIAKGLAPRDQGAGART